MCVSYHFYKILFLVSGEWMWMVGVLYNVPFFFWGVMQKGEERFHGLLECVQSI
jgi:hypothetical protein